MPGRPDGILSVLREYRGDRLSIGTIVVLGLASALLEGFALVILVPIAEAVATDSITLGGRAGDLIGRRSTGELVALGVIAVVFASAAKVVAMFLQVRLVRRVDDTSKRRAFTAYLAASGPTQQRHRAGRLIDTINRAGGRSTRLGNAIASVQALLSVAVLIAGAIVVQPTGAAVIVGVGLLLFFMFRPLIKRSREASGRATRALQPMTEHVAETEAARVELRVFDAEGWAGDEHHRHVRALTAARTRHAVLAGLVTPLYQGTALVGLFAVLAVARSSETLDIASLGAVALLLLRSLSYGQAFQATYQKLNDSGAVSTLFLEAVAELEEHPRRLGEKQLGPVRDVELRGVTFSYEVAGRPAIRDVDLVLRSGERVGLVGPSGAGKTTMAQVLLRMLEPTRGTYLVNGESAGTFDAQSWSQQVAIVPQRPHLLHGTVHDNIAMFRRGTDRAAVIEAANMAGLHDTITGLGDGYDTHIGPASRSISGGQIQRLGIARALAAEPTFLVLDEPTSALDTESDRWIQLALANLSPDTLVVLIAHRMSTLAICDRIVVVEDGVIAQDGEPEFVALESRYFAVTRQEGSDVARPGRDQPTGTGHSDRD